MSESTGSNILLQYSLFVTHAPSGQMMGAPLGHWTFATGQALPEATHSMDKGQNFSPLAQVAVTDRPTHWSGVSAHEPSKHKVYLSDGHVSVGGHMSDGDGLMELAGKILDDERAEAESAANRLQLPSAQRKGAQTGQPKVVLQLVARITQLPSAHLMLGQDPVWAGSVQVAKLAWQVPSIQRKGAEAAQPFFITQLRASTAHAPFQHLKDASVGQPLINTVYVLQDAALVTHAPLGHFVGIKLPIMGHPLSSMQLLASLAQRPFRTCGTAGFWTEAGTSHR